MQAFKVSKSTLKPEKMISLKPFVLLFDEFYTNIYRMYDAESWMQEAEKIIFLGTSFLDLLKIFIIYLKYLSLKLILKRNNIRI